MTTYGTIPSPSQLPSSSNLEFISRVKARIKTGLSTRRPWKEMFRPSSLTLPASSWESIPRIQMNMVIFRMNYVIIILAILFLSLLWHPVSLIVFIVMMVAWLVLFFLRDEPLVIFGRVIDDRFVMMGLFLGTIIALSFTHATDNIIVALSVGIGVVIFHGAFRDTNDLFLDESATPLRETASDTYSLA